jgi:two-component system NtrC family sensor kinase
MDALNTLFRGSRLQNVLIAAFSVVVVLTVGINAYAVSRVIRDYLITSQDARVARDMGLAEAFYAQKLKEIDEIGLQLTQPPYTMGRGSLIQGDEIARIDDEIKGKLSLRPTEGTLIILALDPSGKVLTGSVISPSGAISPAMRAGDWSDLPIVRTVINSGISQSATEVIPSELLAQVGLDEQALIGLKITPRASEKPFDPREGTAGLGLVSVHPAVSADGVLTGEILAAHLFNNDFTLVDRIKEVAGVDTVTIFFGDMRVSTNVPDAVGERAVGTIMSSGVRKVVLEEGSPFKGEAFVVKEPFITRYEPLKNHLGQVVGSLYVGARLSKFQGLANGFNKQVAILALVSMILAGLVAIPVARFIARPIAQLVEATRELARGNMTVRVDARGKGEFATLGQAFNRMVEALNRTQRELLHKEKLASMGQLSAGVAHEINNPLATILLLSNVLHDETPEGSPHREDLEMIIKETTRSQRIVAGLLNFARQQELALEWINIEDLLEEAIEASSHEVDLAGISIRRSYAEDVPPVQADPAQLLQVFVNIIRNGVEAMKGSGTLSLETGKADRQTIQITISDTGTGMSVEDQGKLFTPFYSTKGVGEGTGLGLSIAYGIIKMHRGQISVKSRLGEGSAFTVVLPIQQVQLGGGIDGGESRS